MPVFVRRLLDFDSGFRRKSIDSSRSRLIHIKPVEGRFPWIPPEYQ